jgi:hypothetical protein
LTRDDGARAREISEQPQHQIVLGRARDEVRSHLLQKPRHLVLADHAHALFLPRNLAVAKPAAHELRVKIVAGTLQRNVVKK